MSHQRHSRLLFCLLTVLLIVANISIAHAQTFTVLHSFTGGGDGFSPTGMAIDSAGHFYGATRYGGSHGWGVVYRLANKDSNWTLLPIYSFLGDPDGGEPNGVVIGPDGKLYGTTWFGGEGSGTVFNLAPPATICVAILCPWTETQLHIFTEFPDGAQPTNADLAFDQSGNIYGTTITGGDGGIFGGCQEFGCGTVYELGRTGNGWDESVLYQFVNGADHNPWSGVVRDSAGNLYGTAGDVYRLSQNGNNWIQTTIYNFPDPGDGTDAQAGLVMDASGNLYGSTTSGGSGNGGTAFELSPSQGGWTFNVIYSFFQLATGAPGGPVNPLTIDAAGNLYGATLFDGAYGHGNVFKLTRQNGSWSYTSLHDFTAGSDGAAPISKILIDSQGNLYGSATYGGIQNANCDGGCGVIFKITP
jgi:uncharacterized repeat protein (TIGR03803 family)